MGTVYLVGAGPGDPGLLTRRGARLLRRADVVVYDALVNPLLLDLAPPHGVLIDVGKRAGGSRTPQPVIDALLVDAAKRARIVVRLKGGDPFVFGRGGEEALALREAGVRYRVVPGVTAGVAVPAYAGIPVTHRGAAAAVTFVTAHGATGPADVDWSALVRTGGTLVVFMPVARLRDTTDALIAAGMAATTPAAAVEWGTYRRQRVVTAPVADLATTVETARLGTPATVVIGAVAAYADRLAWYRPGPLAGMRVLVPRARPQPSRLARRLEALGADVHALPKLSPAPPPDPDALRAAVRSARRYTTLLVTSRAGVDALFDALAEQGLDARALAGVSVAAAGTATARALLRRGVRPDVAIASYHGVTLLDRLGGARAVRGSAVLYLGGAIGPFEGAEALQRAGASVDRVQAVGQKADATGVAAARCALDEGAIDWIVFASSSTVASFCDTFGPAAGRARVLAIGPTTACAARERGLLVDLVPADHTPEGLVTALVGVVASGPPPSPASFPAAGRPVEISAHVGSAVAVGPRADPATFGLAESQL